MLRYFRKVLRKTPLHLNPKDAYNLWSETYDGERNPVKSFSDAMISELLPDMNGKTLLDVGCGTGYACNLALQHGSSRVLGLDISENMIAKAQNLIQNSKADFRVIHDSQPFITDEKFDIAICALVLAHAKDPSLILRSVYDALRPGGIMIITDFHPQAAHQGMKRTFEYHGVTYAVTHHTYTIDTYRTMLGNAGFLIIQSKEREWKKIPVVFAMLCTRN